MTGLTIHYCLICFELFYQLDPLVLEMNFVAVNTKLIFSMQNVNIIVNKKLQSFSSLHISNKIIYTY